MATGETNWNGGQLGLWWDQSCSLDDGGGDGDILPCDDDAEEVGMPAQRIEELTNILTIRQRPSSCALERHKGERFLFITAHTTFMIFTNLQPTECLFASRW